ncbi:hypothetical protein QFZ27_006346 [Inquilinus ginsengisoli]|uniref:hypothetical protein n=1 Tax=Inquilinus ginsengisoli TaxID=363840 RepID=UPI003D1ADC86
MSAEAEFADLTAFLARVPGIAGAIGTGVSPDGEWWAKFTIDIAHPLAWNVVQELGHVLNYMSLDDRLPTVFMPVSPPPYANGGPADFLSWVIECRVREFTPQLAAKWLEGRLPRPVDDLTQWETET